MVVHIHPEDADKMNMIEIAREFIEYSQMRLHIFLTDFKCLSIVNEQYCCFFTGAIQPVCHSGCFHLLPVDEESDKKLHRKEDVWSKKSCPSHTSMCFFLWLNLSFLVWSSDITASWTTKAHPRAYQCIGDNYVILAQKYCNSTFLSMWVVYDA